MELTRDDLSTLEALLISSAWELSMKIRGLDGLEGGVIEKIRVEFEEERKRIVDLSNRIAKEKWHRDNPGF